MIGIQGRRGRAHGRSRGRDDGEPRAAAERPRALPPDLVRLAPAALQAALAAMPWAALVVRAPAEILHANPRGLVLLHHARARVEAALAGGDAQPLVRVPVDETHFIALLPDLAQDARARLSVIERRWALTPRQSAVLELVAEGLPNRTVAERLACSEKTVELHVSALLTKARCVGRAQLVARFWTEHG